ncbi:MAG: FixH family protein, partial [Pseudomonadota bacterium]
YKQADDVVIDNYYKKGRMINQRIEEDRVAKEAELGADLRFDMMSAEVLLELSATDASVLPETVMLHLDHPVEADFDTQIVLHNIAPGRYRADLDKPLAHRWYVRLMPKVNAENAGKFWRLVGEMNFADRDYVKLGSYE